MRISNSLKIFFISCKPGIVVTNNITALAGFLFASNKDINLQKMLALIIGVTSVVAAGCVVNNFIDKDIDRIMFRTQKRILATSKLDSFNTFISVALLLFISLFTFINFINNYAAILAIVAFIFYTVIYSLWSKRYTIHATTIGAVAGAMPPVIGYVAAKGYIDLVAVLLFLILLFWQMIHFYAIAIFRIDDYDIAAIPTRVAVKGIHNTKMHMIFYHIALLFTVTMLYGLAYITLISFTIIFTISILFLLLSLFSTKINNDYVWSKTVFIFSVVYISIFSVVISFN